MRYFADTNLFLDIILEDFISKEVRSILENYENVFYISSESVKEFIHLIHKGKITTKNTINELDVFDFLEKSLGFKVKFLAKEHYRTFAKLETVEEHNDLSDRLIISQAITERIPLISSDKKFRKYKSQGLELILNVKK